MFGEPCSDLHGDKASVEAAWTASRSGWPTSRSRARFPRDVDTWEELRNGALAGGDRMSVGTRSAMTAWIAARRAAWPSRRWSTRRSRRRSRPARRWAINEGRRGLIGAVSGGCESRARWSRSPSGLHRRRGTRTPLALRDRRRGRLGRGARRAAARSASGCERYVARRGSAAQLHRRWRWSGARAALVTVRGGSPRRPAPRMLVAA